MIQQHLGKIISIVLLAIILVIGYPYITKLFKHMIASNKYDTTFYLLNYPEFNIIHENKSVIIKKIENAYDYMLHVYIFNGTCKEYSYVDSGDVFYKPSLSVNNNKLYLLSSLVCIENTKNSETVINVKKQGFPYYNNDEINKILNLYNSSYSFLKIDFLKLTY